MKSRKKHICALTDPKRLIMRDSGGRDEGVVICRPCNELTSTAARFSLRLATHLFSIGFKRLIVFINASIFTTSTGTCSWRQQSEQECSNFPVLTCCTFSSFPCVPRPAERHSSSVSFPEVSFHWELQGTPPQGGVQEKDAQAKSTTPDVKERTYGLMTRGEKRNVDRQ